ncbi:MAG: helix-hairpin-helix domain-containing protein, partial [Ferruginibacter sp.]|nr:helix-hairpin-helix domain-containing protein [Ferruginibacter sp.]
MTKKAVFILFLFIAVYGNAQVPQKPENEPVQPSTTIEQLLENITENNEDVETEDDTYLQEMLQYQKSPINLNTANESLLKDLRTLSPMQIQYLINYSNLLGKLINVYELQSIPGWDIATIQKIRPYITINENQDIISSLKSRLKNGDNTLLVRVTQIVEQSKGYLIDPAAGKNYYQGSPQRLLVRYRYNYKNILQYGV